jgi:hypothetical protein
MKRWLAIISYQKCPLILCGALLVGVIAGGAGLAGCSSKAASPRWKAPEPAVPGSSVPSRQPERPAKPVARESAFSTYSSPEYGVAFRYPRNFALVEQKAPVEREASMEVNDSVESADSLENAPEDSSGARSQAELESEEPGAVLVATVIVPDDAYPNTTFAGGSLQLAVNRYLTAGTCRRNLISRLGDSNGRSGSATIQGVEFAWADSDEGDASTEFFERDYAGFANGACYELFLRVGVGASDADGTRPPDEKKILGHMEKIVSSLQFVPQGVSVLDRSPSGPISRARR